MKKIILLGISLLGLLATATYIKNNPTLYKTSYHINQEIETYEGSKPTYKNVDYTINYIKGTNIITTVNENGRVVTMNIDTIKGDTLYVPYKYVLRYFIFGTTIKETREFYSGGKYTKEYIY